MMTGTETTNLLMQQQAMMAGNANYAAYLSAMYGRGAMPQVQGMQMSPVEDPRGFLGSFAGPLPGHHVWGESENPYETQAMGSRVGLGTVKAGGWLLEQAPLIAGLATLLPGVPRGIDPYFHVFKSFGRGVAGRAGSIPGATAAMRAAPGWTGTGAMAGLRSAWGAGQFGRVAMAGAFSALPMAAAMYGGFKAAEFGIENIIQGAQEQLGINQVLMQYGTRAALPGMRGATFSSMDMLTVGRAARSIVDDPNNLWITSGDVSQVLQAGLQGGSFSGVRNAGELGAALKELTGTLKEVARTFNTTLGGAMPILGQMKGLGFLGAGDAVDAAHQIRGLSVAGGLSAATVFQAGQFGMSMALRAGRGYRGIQDSVQRSMEYSAGLGALHTAGTLSDERLFELTGMRGEEAIAALSQQQTGAAYGVAGTRFGRWAVQAMVDPVTGELTAGGTPGLKGIMGGARRLMGSRRGIINWRLRGQEYTQQAISEMGPDAFNAQVTESIAQYAHRAFGGDEDLTEYFTSKLTNQTPRQIQTMRLLAMNAPRIQAEVGSAMRSEMDRMFNQNQYNENVSIEAAIQKIKQKTITQWTAPLREWGAKITQSVGEGVNEALEDFMGVRRFSVGGAYTSAYQSAQMGNPAAWNALMRSAGATDPVTTTTMGSSFLQGEGGVFGNFGGGDPYRCLMSPQGFGPAALSAPAAGYMLWRAPIFGRGATGMASSETLMGRIAGTTLTQRGVGPGNLTFGSTFIRTGVTAEGAPVGDRIIRSGLINRLGGGLQNLGYRMGPIDPAAGRLVRMTRFAIRGVPVGLGKAISAGGRLLNNPITALAATAGVEYWALSNAQKAASAAATDPFTSSLLLGMRPQDSRYWNSGMEAGESGLYLPTSKDATGLFGSFTADIRMTGGDPTAMSDDEYQQRVYGFNKGYSYHAAGMGMEGDDSSKWELSEAITASRKAFPSAVRMKDSEAASFLREIEQIGPMAGLGLGRDASTELRSIAEAAISSGGTVSEVAADFMKGMANSKAFFTDQQYSAISAAMSLQKNPSSGQMEADVRSVEAVFKSAGLSLQSKSIFGRPLAESVMQEKVKAAVAAAKAGGWSGLSQVSEDLLVSGLSNPESKVAELNAKIRSGEYGKDAAADAALLSEVATRPAVQDQVVRTLQQFHRRNNQDIADVSNSHFYSALAGIRVGLDRRYQMGQQALDKFGGRIRDRLGQEMYAGVASYVDAMKDMDAGNDEAARRQVEAALGRVKDADLPAAIRYLRGIPDLGGMAGAEGLSRNLAAVHGGGFGQAFNVLATVSGAKGEALQNLEEVLKSTKVAYLKAGEKDRASVLSGAWGDISEVTGLGREEVLGLLRATVGGQEMSSRQKRLVRDAIYKNYGKPEGISGQQVAGGDVAAAFDQKVKVIVGSLDKLKGAVESAAMGLGKETLNTSWRIPFTNLRVGY